MATINDYVNIRPGQYNPDLTVKSGTPVARPSNIADNPMAVYSKALSNALGPDIFEGVNVLRGIVLLRYVRQDPDSLALGEPQAYARVMVPELHYGKINPFMTSTLEEYVKVSEKFYPRFPVISSVDNVASLGSLGPGAEVLVTFRDPNKSFGEITFIDTRTGPFALAKETFTAQGRSARLSFTQAPQSPIAGPSLNLPTGGATSAGYSGGCPDILQTQRIQESADRLGMEPEILAAIAKVESGRRGATSLRFEPHIFLRNNKKYEGQIPYTRGDSFCPESRKGKCLEHVSYKSEETNATAFEIAYAIDPDAAISATSFGSFQVIANKNIRRSLTGGGSDPEEFIERFRSDPEGLSQDLLETYMGRVKTKSGKSLIEVAKEKDWVSFAERYNGAGQAKQGYSDKLEAAYNALVNNGCFPRTSPT